MENKENKYQTDNNEINFFKTTSNYSKQKNNQYIESINDCGEKHGQNRERKFLCNIQPKIYGQGKGISPTIFDEKIKNNSPNEISSIIKGQNENKNINKDDFLQVRKIKKISSTDFEKLRNEIIGSENLELLYEDIINYDYLSLNEIDFSANVGCMLPFAFLVENLFNNDAITIEEMNYRYELFKKYIYNYRPIKGDGNCFYRAVIFRYLEIVILNRQIDLIKNIIYEMDESFKSNEIRSRMRIRYDFVLNQRLVLQIMMIILNLLEEDKVIEAHYFFVKSMVVEDSFDYGLILYFRYIFYLYIKQNENKTYLENFAIKIGNLLPSNFETDKGMSLFNKFYYLYLLSMFTDAEKIIIHLTPFVLGINLDIIIFNDNEDKKIKNMIYAGENDYNFTNDKLFVLNICGHYELLYTEEDNNKYKNIFNNYINDYYANIKIKEENMPKEANNIKQEESKKEENENYENNNFIYESSSIPSNIKTNDINLKNNNLIEKREEKQKEINDFNQTKNKYKFQIKTINYTEKKSKKSLNIENEKTEEKNKFSDIIKYSEKKDLNYTNLIQNKNNEEKNKADNEEIKNIDIAKINLMDKINNEKLVEENKNENDCMNQKNILLNTKKNDDSKLSNIINYEENQDIIKENSELKKIRCEICSNNNINKIENDLFQNICEKCLKKNIINQLYSIFLTYMEDLISEKMYELAFKTYFNDFLETKFDVLNKKISIKDALKILDNKVKSNLEMHPLFQEFKQKFCIFCLGELDKTRYELPCKCNFCSIEHIKKHFHIKNSFRNKSNYICICSHEYTNEDIYNIGIFFLKNKLYSLKEDTIDYLNRNYLNNQCCFCSISLDSNHRNRIKIKDFEDEIVLGDTNKLRHYLCGNCFFQYQNNVEFFSCFICNKNHMIDHKQYYY